MTGAEGRDQSAGANGSSASCRLAGPENMPLRFSRRLSIVPGLRVNLSKSGASLSVGHRGAWYSVGPRGQRATIGLPGTGLFWTEKVSPAAPLHSGHRWAFILVLLVLVWLAVRVMS